MAIDKLKPFGFNVHSCIDGPSRKLIWLKVEPSNKNQDVIAHYYLDAISELKGVSHIIKANDGTEHALIEKTYWSILQRDRLGWGKGVLQHLLDYIKTYQIQYF